MSLRELIAEATKTLPEGALPDMRPAYEVWAFQAKLTDALAPERIRAIIEAGDALTDTGLTVSLHAGHRGPYSECARWGCRKFRERSAAWDDVTR